MESIDLTGDDEPIDLLDSDCEHTEPVSHQPSCKTVLHIEAASQHKSNSALCNLRHTASSARRRTAQLSRSSSAAGLQPVALPAQQGEPAKGLLDPGQQVGAGSAPPPCQSKAAARASQQQSAASTAAGPPLPSLGGISALPSASTDAQTSLSLPAASAVAKIKQQQQSAPLQAGSTEPTPVELTTSHQQLAPPTDDGCPTAISSPQKRAYHPPRHSPTVHTQRNAPKPHPTAGQVAYWVGQDLQQAAQRNSASAMEQMAQRVIQSQQAAQTQASSHAVAPGECRYQLYWLCSKLGAWQYAMSFILLLLLLLSSLFVTVTLPLLVDIMASMSSMEQQFLW